MNLKQTACKSCLRDALGPTVRALSSRPSKEATYWEHLNLER